MKNRNVLSCTALLLAAGCATAPPEPAPEAFFAAPIVDVRESHGTERYWQWKQSRYSFRPASYPSYDQPCWFARIEYVIDSNGNVFNAEVVEVRPDDRFATDALRMLALHEYVPTETNADRVPIHTTINMEMKMNGQSCERE